MDSAKVTGEKTEETEVPLAVISTRYHDEMKKLVKGNMHLLPAQLLEHHNKSVKLVLEKCGEGKQRESTAVLETLFKKYQTQNDMNLNSGRVAVTPAIGIDLGTTYCCVAVYYQGKVTIIPNQKHEGQLTTPSYVSYDADGSVTVGTSAKETAFENPENTIYDAKRIIGRAMDDEKLQSDMKAWPFSVVADEGSPKIKLTNGRLLHPEQVSAELLKECREIAEDYLQLPSGTIKKAVITVPAYFEDGQKQATLNAGTLAGLEVLTLLSEPTAAAIAYSLERLDTDARKVLIFDMGGGTFDVAVLEVNLDDIEVLGVFGDTHLGGEDFDRKLMDYCAEEFKRLHNIDLFLRKGSTKKEDVTRRMKRTLVHCETAKKRLSCGKNVRITVDAVTKRLDLKVELTREKFEELIDDHFKRSIAIVDAALKKAGVAKDDIDDVVLVGGSTRIPRIQQLVSEYFGGKVLNKSIHPDHAVAYGAAIKAAMMNGEKTRGEMGRGNLRIQDVTPFSLGIRKRGGILSVILPKNSKIPAEKTAAFCTVADFQSRMNIKVFQGEDFEVAANNRFLGEFILRNIPPAPKRKEYVEVTMKINEMGILEVSAVIRSTKGSKKIIIGEDRLGMSKEEVERLSSASKSDPAA